MNTKKTNLLIGHKQHTTNLRFYLFELRLGYFRNLHFTNYFYEVQRNFTSIYNIMYIQEVEILIFPETQEITMQL